MHGVDLLTSRADTVKYFDNQKVMPSNLQRAVLQFNRVQNSGIPFIQSTLYFVFCTFCTKLYKMYKILVFVFFLYSFLLYIQKYKNTNIYKIKFLYCMQIYKNYLKTVI